MRFTVSPEQLKFFYYHQYLELDNVLTDEDVEALLSAIDAIYFKSPGYAEENLFRSIKLIPMLVKKRGWGEIASILLHKKPLRMAHDRFYRTAPLMDKNLDDDACGILIDLHTRKGIFFKNCLSNKLYRASGYRYFFLILTAKYLPQVYPIIIT